jgi:hypothetical protein
MVVHIEVTFVNGLTHAASREVYFLGDAGIDGHIALSDQIDFDFDKVILSLEGLYLRRRWA